MKIVYRSHVKAKNSVVLDACLWCSVSLEPETAVQGSVCQKCYNLMINAGLKEAEIFGEKEKKQKAA